MNCRTIEPLLLAERDGVLTPDQHARLDEHAAGCPGCRRLRASLAEVAESMQADAAQVRVPDAGDEWRMLEARLASEIAKPAKKRPLAPVIWFSAPLAAAAAVAIAFFVSRPFPAQTDPAMPTAETARADYVEAGDVNASTMVYVDKDSGWLVVWAVDSGTKNSG